MTLSRSARRALLSATALCAFAAPAAAQTANASAPTAPESGIEEIVVTAQRSAQSLQDVPIAVSAFTAEGLERQQLNNTSQLQLALPNITFTKGNFTGANLTIRGIGSPAVATSGDAGVGIHYNDAPIQGPLIFETEFFDLERLEVLRGPQGTQFGRNATGGVMNFITAKPVIGELQARAEGEYGNYNSIRGFGMVNIPLGDKVAVRIAGQYINRDGYTLNVYDGQRFDNRKQGAVRASIRFRPTDATTIDLIGYYFSENDQRMRIQKQACLTDPTGILGCQPDGLAINQAVNPNATLGNIIQSREFAQIALGATPLGPIAAGLGNLSVYTLNPQGANPNDVRQVNTNFTPSYRAREKFAQLKISQDFDTFNLGLTGSFQESSVRSRQDYNNISSPGPGQNATLRSVFPATAARLYSGTNYCISNANRNYSGIYGNDTLGCFRDATQYDQSNGSSQTWSAEAVLRSQFEGRFNFLLGGIYLENRADSDYFIVSTGLDYGAGLLGAGQFQASPFFNNETNAFKLRSYGLFAEAYVNLTDTLKLTAGARYSNDKKSVKDRALLLFATPLPLGTVDANTPIGQRADQDVSIPGIQPYRLSNLNSNAVTGRVVLDWKPDVGFTDDTLVYASYSRGYKPGGINPAFDPTLFTAPVTFLPEYIDAFEVGTKNRFIGGAFQANLTAFYYKYKNLQISRIINRTSFNDNTNADVWGVEGEFIAAPVRGWLFNITASYLKTKVKDLTLVDVRDPSGGRSDTVIIKDLTLASNCVVTPSTPLPAGSAAALVNGVNSAFGGLVRPAVPVPGTPALGAFGICSALAGAIASAPPALAAAFGVAPGSRLPFVLDVGRVPALPAGNPVDLSGNELQNSPRVKGNFGAQYTADIGTNGMTAVFRGDINFVGSQWARNFNRPIDRIEPYETINLSVQLNGPDDRWYVRGFVQNLTNNQGITGQYTTDPSSGLFTNIFTLEPRRFGGVVGVRF